MYVKNPLHAALYATLLAHRQIKLPTDHPQGFRFRTQPLSLLPEDVAPETIALVQFLEIFASYHRGHAGALLSNRHLGGSVEHRQRYLTKALLEHLSGVQAHFQARRDSPQTDWLKEVLNLQVTRDVTLHLNLLQEYADSLRAKLRTELEADGLKARLGIGFSRGPVDYQMTISLTDGLMVAKRIHKLTCLGDGQLTTATLAEEGKFQLAARVAIETMLTNYIARYRAGELFTAQDRLVADSTEAERLIAQATYHWTPSQRDLVRRHQHLFVKALR